MAAASILKFAKLKLLMRQLRSFLIRYIQTKFCKNWSNSNGMAIVFEFRLSHQLEIGTPGFLVCDKELDISFPRGYVGVQRYFTVEGSDVKAISAEIRPSSDTGESLMFSSGRISS